MLAAARTISSGILYQTNTVPRVISSKYKIRYKFKYIRATIEHRCRARIIQYSWYKYTNESGMQMVDTYVLNIISAVIGNYWNVSNNCISNCLHAESLTILQFIWMSFSKVYLLVWIEVPLQLQMYKTYNNVTDKYFIEYNNQFNSCLAAK